MSRQMTVIKPRGVCPDAEPELWNLLFRHIYKGLKMPEGFYLIPKAPTPEQINKLKDALCRQGEKEQK